MAKRRRDDDPIGNYVEWTQNSLNPGHYLGGTIPPDLRKASLGRRARRSSGALLIASGVIGLALIPTFVADGDSDGWRWFTAFPGVALSLLVFGAGISMLRSAGPSKPSTPTRRRKRR
jgi:hypothetical protein